MANPVDFRARRIYLRLLSAGALSAAAFVATSCRRTVAPFSCLDTSALSAAERAARDALKYTDSATIRERTCEHCIQFAPATASTCGSCKLMKGPVHPQGSCLAWANRD